jgi:hypothetical protein
MGDGGFPNLVLGGGVEVDLVDRAAGGDNENVHVEVREGMTVGAARFVGKAFGGRRERHGLKTSFGPSLSRALSRASSIFPSHFKEFPTKLPTRIATKFIEATA